MTEAYTVFNLVETSDKIFIYPSGGNTVSEIIVINRVTDEISLSNNASQIQSVDRIRTIQIVGITGVIHLIGGPYLLVIKSKVRVGEIRSHVIWQAGEYEVIPFKRTNLHLAKNQVDYNATYLDMINTVLSTPHFYFSHSYDLSHNLQSLDSNSPEFFKQSILERADGRFIWNHSLLTTFNNMVERGQKTKKHHRFCIPLIHGFAAVSNMTANSRQFKFILISRRSWKRAGTRLFSRGIDSSGSVSNFVETEQIVEYDGDMTSFVQIRGSIPLYWSQRPNLRYKPKPELLQHNNAEAYSKHFNELFLHYGKIVCVNLINQTGSEGSLHVAFKDQSEESSIPNTRYEAFDFHHECRKMNWGRLEILMNRLEGEVQEFGYYIRSRGQIHIQEGVFRTNCIDCLDRTNVVQGMLARINLNNALRRMNILMDGERIENYPDLEYSVKNIWADNGDVISTEYSGTGALKTDFTRTGKRTYLGALQDGYNSAVRYLKNNFLDGFRQDAIDLFVGNYSVKVKEGVDVPSPLENRTMKRYAPALFLLVSIAVWAASVISYFWNRDSPPEYLVYVLFWGLMTFGTGGYMVYFGTEFVDNPVLTDTPKTM
ncbi:unnamed protein product [Orchesella dallaii]|uniref:Phosphatidylinositol-3-phosphatase SAC1 n=1 Tax=Orchesella dallaii TaxID=48710 RepID=A0ABP1QC28_9HEXA